MKIIFSRKGIESSSGGGASPVFPDDRFISLPIPYSHSPVTYHDIVSEISGIEYGELIEQLTPTSSDSPTHLDPDLRHGARNSRHSAWKPAFGQAGAALGHLRNKGVGEGALFLFYGRFQPVEGPPWKYRNHPEYKNGDFQAVWGWLRVDKVIDLDYTPIPPGNADHPHAYGDYAGGNALFVAAERLNLPSLENFPGGGVLPRLRHLTASGHAASHWDLPKGITDGVLTHQRQERVGDTDSCPQLLEWAYDLLSDLRHQKDFQP